MRYLKLLFLFIGISYSLSFTQTENKNVLHPGLVGCVDINGITYRLYGYYETNPSDLTVAAVYWNGGNVGHGNYGTFYFSPIYGVSNLQFTGPIGVVTYSGPIYICDL